MLSRLMHSRVIEDIKNDIGDIFLSIMPFFLTVIIIMGLFCLKKYLRKYFEKKNNQTQNPLNPILSSIWSHIQCGIPWIKKHLMEIFDENGAPETPLDKIWHLTWIVIIFSAGIIGLSISLGISNTSTQTHIAFIRVATSITTIVYLYVLQSLFKRLFKDYPTDWGLNPKSLNKVWSPAWFVIILISGILSLSGSFETLGISAAIVGGLLGVTFQTPLKGTVGCLMIIVRKPFKNGDYIKIGSIKGKVADISLTTITLKDTNQTDSGTVYIPNSTLFDQAIINYTKPSSETEAPKENGEPGSGDTSDSPDERE